MKKNIIILCIVVLIFFIIISPIKYENFICCDNENRPTIYGTRQFFKELEDNCKCKPWFTKN